MTTYSSGENTAETGGPGTELELAGRGDHRDDNVSFLTLAARFTRLAIGAMRLSETVAAGQRRAARNAEASNRLAELMASAEVDARHVAAMHEIARQQQITAEATGDMAGAATDLASDADAADSAHRAEYQDLYDEGQAMAANGIAQPRPGWFVS